MSDKAFQSLCNATYENSCEFMKQAARRKQDEVFFTAVRIGDVNRIIEEYPFYSYTVTPTVYTRNGKDVICYVVKATYDRQKARSTGE